MLRSFTVKATTTKKGGGGDLQVLHVNDGIACPLLLPLPVTKLLITHSSSIRHHSTVTAMSIGQPENDFFIYGRDFLIGTID
jgi:hypothetical protein